MMKLVNLIRDALVVILALFTSFGLGMIFSVRVFETAIKELSDESRETRRRTSYRYYSKERQESQ